MALLKISLFLMGVFSLFAIPRYHGFIIVDIFLLSSFFISVIFVFLKKNITFSKFELFFLSIGLLYYSAVQIGTLNYYNFTGLLTAQLFFLAFLTVFISYKLNDDLSLIFVLIKGFVYSALITAIFIIIEEVYYYMGGFASLSHLMFNKFAPEGVHLTITENIKWLGVLYRPSGFSWDPGLSITALVIAFILIREAIISVEFKKLILLLLFLSIIISIDKTSIIAMFLYLIFKFFQNKWIVLYPKFKVHFLTVTLVFTFLFLLYFGFFIRYNKIFHDQDYNHLKYLGSLFYLYKENPFEFLFGFGYKGIGSFFNHNIKWLQSLNMKFSNGAGPESTLTDMFFFGGIIGLFYWFFTFIYTFMKGDNHIKLLMFSMFFILYGYTINSTWFNCIYISLFFLSYHNFKNQKIAVIRRNSTDLTG
jgi:hypothetical protein